MFKFISCFLWTESVQTKYPKVSPVANQTKNWKILVWTVQELKAYRVTRVKWEDDEEDNATQPLVLSPPNSPMLHSLYAYSPHLIPHFHQHWSWESWYLDTFHDLPVLGGHVEASHPHLKLHLLLLPPLVVAHGMNPEHRIVFISGCQLFEVLAPPWWKHSCPSRPFRRTTSCRTPCRRCRRWRSPSSSSLPFQTGRGSILAVNTFYLPKDLTTLYFVQEWLHPSPQFWILSACFSFSPKLHPLLFEPDKKVFKPTGDLGEPTLTPLTSQVSLVLART